MPVISTESYDSGAPRYASMCSVMTGCAVAIADAVLHDAAHVAGIDREELAGHGLRRHLRLDLVGDAIELPAQRVGNHRHRLGQPDVTHAPVLDLLLELLAGQAGADLLLERQAADPRVLDAIDAIASTRSQTPVSVIGSASMAKPGIDAGAEHRHLRFLRQLVDLLARSAGSPSVGYDSSSVVETIGTFSFRIVSICGITPFSDELVHSTTTSGLPL